MSKNFYYNKLNKMEQKAYHSIYEGLSSMAPSFSVPRLDGKTLGDIYFMVRLDHPEVFYSVHFKYRFYEQADNVEMIPEYIFEKKKLQDHKQAMEARVRKLCLPAAKMNEKEKELYIHDFICQNITYDKLKKAYSHEIIGPLGHGVSVCEGIAKTVKILCDNLGVWCIVAVSHANPEKGIKYRHAWNILRINGKYYHLDATFDNSLGKGSIIRYDYVNLGDKQLFRDHQPVIWQVPACEDNSQSYYQEKKLSFTKMEDIAKRTSQNAKKGKEFVFGWRGSYLTKEVLKEIMEIVHAAAAEKGKKAVISLNWPQAIFQLHFEEAAVEAETEILLQEANEGELYEGEENEEIV